LEAFKDDSNQSPKNSEDTNDGASQSAAVIFHVKKSTEETSNIKNENSVPLIKAHQDLGFRCQFHQHFMLIFFV